MVGLGYGDEFDFEYEGGASGDAGLVQLAVGLFGRDVDFPFVTGVHLLHCDYPTGYEVA